MHPKIEQLFARHGGVPMRVVSSSVHHRNSIVGGDRIRGFDFKELPYLAMKFSMLFDGHFVETGGPYAYGGFVIKSGPQSVFGLTLQSILGKPLSRDEIVKFVTSDMSQDPDVLVGKYCICNAHPVLPRDSKHFQMEILKVMPFIPFDALGTPAENRDAIAAARIFSNSIAEMYESHHWIGREAEWEIEKRNRRINNAQFDAMFADRELTIEKNDDDN